MSYSYKYARPAVTVDCVVFARDKDDLKVLLIERAREPFQGCWALPGGFAEVGETLEQSARRELAEETGLKDVDLEQLRAFSEPARDPREHVISVAFFALVKLPEQQVRAASDASRADWFALDSVPELAFDHQLILQTACRRLQRKLASESTGFKL